MSNINSKKTIVKYPKLMNEWNWDKNDALRFNPNEITYGSTKKVWWKCNECSYEWQATPNSRTGVNSSNCPVCSNRVIVAGVNDLASLAPNVAKLWNYEKNGELTPQKISVGSNKSVWWKCNKCGQSWQTKICHMTRQKSHCPICAGQKIIAGYNDLLTIVPHLKDEWDYDKNKISPIGLASSSQRKVWWKCSRGHSYYTSIVSRARMKTGCPQCAKPYQSSISEKIIGVYLGKYFSDIQFNVHPEWLGGKELDIFLPSINVAIEYDGGLWHKDIARDIEKDSMCEGKVDLIRIREATCPIYNSNVLKIYAEKASGSHIELEKPIITLIDYLNDKYRCTISNDINLERDIRSIFKNIDLIEIEQSVYNTELVNEWNYEKNDNLDPKYISVGQSKLKLWWKCRKCGYEWEQSPYVRYSMKCGCPACNHQVAVKGKTLGDLYPDLIKEWNNEKNKLTPFDYLPRSNKKVWWRCKKCGYDFSMTIDHRTTRKSGCPLCAHTVLVKGVNDLSTTYPNIALDWNIEKNDINACDISGGTNKKYWWKCHICGHEWEQVVASRTKLGRKCPKCKG